jgi:ATPase subunit of ABC transporter with duplicated ATPase domains
VAPADVLLLREPTNHLDLETTRWLEDHLLSIDATVLVISHDRAFLARLADHILHAEIQYHGLPHRLCGLRRAAGGAAAVSQQRAYDRQRRSIRIGGGFYRRNIAGGNSAQAKDAGAASAAPPARRAGREGRAIEIDSAWGPGR